MMPFGVKQNLIKICARSADDVNKRTKFSSAHIRVHTFICSAVNMLINQIYEIY